MNFNRSLLAYFLSPVLLLLLAALAFGSWALHQIRQEFDTSLELIASDLQTIERAAAFSQELNSVHHELMNTLTSVEKKQIDRLQLHQKQEDLFQQLAPMQQLIDRMPLSPLLADINQDTTSGLTRAFNDYRHFTLLSIEAVLADPSISSDYLDLAEQKSQEFNDYTNQMSQLLAERTRLRARQTAASFTLSVKRQLITWLLILASLVAILVVAVRLITRKLIVITQALSHLAKEQRSVPLLTEVKKLQETERGEFKSLATALLAVRDSEARRQQTEQENYRLSHFDQLTSLPNRQQMLEYLAHAIKLCKSNQRFGAVIFLDLDQFKSINEAWGPETGDLMLQKVAERLSQEIKDKSALGRLSGDEFVLVMDNLDPCKDAAAQTAQGFAEGLRLQLSQPYSIHGEHFRLTASLGITLFNPDQEDSNSLFSKAESAMYQSKRQGGNLCSFFDPQVQAALEERMWLEKQLEQAIERQQLELHYQLQVNHLCQPLGAEALLRWKHPERGYISPADFIPLAEQTGLILSLGYWVLNTAFHQLKAWQQQPETQHLSLAINISAKQFQKDDLTQQIQTLLTTTGVNPRQLKLELTESAILEQVDATIEKMLQIKQLGLTFSMDDFGTGYSSLQYLKRLPLDQLKIDQSFVKDLPKDQESAAIVETIIAMSSALKLDVIAEGVETQAQKDFLTQHKCCAFQGFLFGRPQPIDVFNQGLKSTQAKPETYRDNFFNSLNNKI